MPGPAYSVNETHNEAPEITEEDVVYLDLSHNALQSVTPVFLAANLIAIPNLHAFFNVPVSGSGSVPTHSDVEVKQYR